MNEKMINIIPEIKMSEAIEGKNFEYYLKKIEPFPIIAINTSSLFDGNIDMLKKARKTYPDKIIIRKDLIILPRQIKKTLSLSGFSGCSEMQYLKEGGFNHISDIKETRKTGADYVLLLAEYLSEKQMQYLIDHCNSKSVFPLIEVNSYKKFKNIETILVNSRNLNTGEINREKAKGVCENYKKEGLKVIYASGENSDIIVREGIADYVLVGTAFMKENLEGVK